jgi:2,3-bisphosphoglycerate-dependent phosphoglycerate mutase
MTHVFFVRHAEPVHSWEDDRTRPLSNEGLKDRFAAMEVLRDHDIGAVYSSPYARSLTAMEPIAEFYNLKIKTDERLRGRQAGSMAARFSRSRRLQRYESHLKYTYHRYFCQ